MNELIQRYFEISGMNYEQRKPFLFELSELKKQIAKEISKETKQKTPEKDGCITSLYEHLKKFSNEDFVTLDNFKSALAKLSEKQLINNFISSMYYFEYRPFLLNDDMFELAVTDKNFLKKISNYKKGEKFLANFIKEEINQNHGNLESIPIIRAMYFDLKPKIDGNWVELKDFSHSFANHSYKTKLNFAHQFLHNNDRVKNVPYLMHKDVFEQFFLNSGTIQDLGADDNHEKYKIIANAINNKQGKVSPDLAEFAIQGMNGGYFRKHVLTQIENSILKDLRDSFPPNDAYNARIIIRDKILDECQNFNGTKTKIFENQPTEVFNLINYCEKNWDKISVEEKIKLSEYLINQYGLECGLNKNIKVEDHNLKKGVLGEYISKNNLTSISEEKISLDLNQIDKSSNITLFKAMMNESMTQEQINIYTFYDYFDVVFHEANHWVQNNAKIYHKNDTDTSLLAQLGKAFSNDKTGHDGYVMRVVEIDSKFIGEAFTDGLPQVNLENKSIYKEVDRFNGLENGLISNASIYRFIKQKEKELVPGAN